MIYCKYKLRILMIDVEMTEIVRCKVRNGRVAAVQIVPCIHALSAKYQPQKRIIVKRETVDSQHKSGYGWSQEIEVKLQKRQTRTFNLLSGGNEERNNFKTSDAFKCILLNNFLLFSLPKYNRTFYYRLSSSYVSCLTVSFPDAWLQDEDTKWITDQYFSQHTSFAVSHSFKFSCTA